MIPLTVVSVGKVGPSQVYLVSDQVIQRGEPRMTRPQKPNSRNQKYVAVKNPSCGIE